MRADIPGNIRMTNPTHFLALGFGTGYAPVMPGTFGTLAAFPLVWLNAMHGHLWLAVCFALVATLAGVWICGRTARDMGVHDHSSIVWDEVAGMMITMLAVPFTWINLLVGFLLFRFFDIVKPWPISHFDKHVHGGTGIMIDDVLAGFAALAVMQVLLYQGWL